MKYTSALISDARNKLGGDVFARNRAGLYVRVKVKPKNPKTSIQQSNRADFSGFTKNWRGLTAAQIAGWNALAASSTLTDTLGNNYQPSGLQLYISCNRNLNLIGAVPITNAPGSKPSFPSILAGSTILRLIGGAYNVLLLGVTSAAFALWENLQASMTPGLSNGMRFVGGSLYRNLGPAITTYSPNVAWLPDSRWPAKVPVPGQNVSAKVRLVDPASGYASMPETVLVTPQFL
jgi:hypothetical protein